MQRLRYGFRLVTGPRADRQRSGACCADNLRYHLDYFASARTTARPYLTQGDQPAADASTRRELAAYAAVASLMLNLDETVTKE